MTSLTLGTAQITEADGLVVVRYMGTGNFLVGEQIFGNTRLGWNAALRFCRKHGLQVLPCDRTSDRAVLSFPAVQS